MLFAVVLDGHVDATVDEDRIDALAYFSNEVLPACRRMKEGANAHDSDPKQVGVFPCRGLVAPRQRAPGSIAGLPVDVKKRGDGESESKGLEHLNLFHPRRAIMRLT